MSSKLAQTPLEPAPQTSNNFFDFLFSNPFYPTSPASFGPLHKNTISKIPLDKPILVEGLTGASITWNQLRVDSLKVAASLVSGQGAGLRPESFASFDPAVNRGAIVSPVVLLLLPNCISFAVIAFGVVASGLTVTGISPASTSSELLYVIRTCLPSAIVTSPSALETLKDAFTKLSLLEQSALGYSTKGNIYLVDPEDTDYLSASSRIRIPSIDESIAQGWNIKTWTTLLSLESPLITFAPPKYSGVEADLRIAIIFWSSGTSGKPKGVLQSHRSLGSGLISLWHGSAIYSGERLIALPPLYHVFGWTNILCVAPSVGNTTVMLPKFDPQVYLRIVQDMKITHLHIAPPLGVLFAKSPMVDGFDLSSITNCTSGGAPLGVSIIRGVQKRLGFTIKMSYGLSEAGSVTVQLSKDWEDHQKILGSVGKVMPGVEVKIVSMDEDLRVLNQGEQGELLIRSPALLRAYYNNVKATEESFDSEGWFRTGDVGKYVDGQVFIEDRLKEIIKVKAYQVAPAELEDGLCNSPLVQDAGVTSIYDEEQASEFPVAYVVPFDKDLLKGGPKTDEFAQTLKTFIESKFTSYKWIRGGFVVVDEIPKSAAGKILRRSLKEKKGHHVQVYDQKLRAKL